MTVHTFGPLVDVRRILVTWLAEIEAWMPEYLAAFERQHTDEDLEPGDTQPPIAYVVRHAGVVKAGEATPAIIVWPAGETDGRTDPDGVVTGTLQIGLVIVAGAHDLESTGDVLHRLVGALRALLLDRTTLAGQAEDLAIVDVDYEGIDAGREGFLQQAEFAIEAYGVVLGQRHAGPGRSARPRPDPTGEWPDAPVAETAVEHLRVEVFDPNDVD